MGTSVRALCEHTVWYTTVPLVLQLRFYVKILAERFEKWRDHQELGARSNGVGIHPRAWIRVYSRKSRDVNRDFLKSGGWGCLWPHNTHPPTHTLTHTHTHTHPHTHTHSLTHTRRFRPPLCASLYVIIIVLIDCSVLLTLRVPRLPICPLPGSPQPGGLYSNLLGFPYGTRVR